MRRPETRKAGGDMGWIQQGDTNHWPGAVVQALFALREPGEISSVVATTNGLFVLRLIKLRPASIASWDEARHRIRTKLAERKEAARAEQFFASLKAGMRIRINRELVHALKEQFRNTPPGTGSSQQAPQP